MIKGFEFDEIIKIYIYFKLFPFLFILFNEC